MIGIIGGTGLYQLEGLSDIESLAVDTPFGEPSAPVTIGSLNGQRVAFLPRHGLHHQILPSEINFRANIWALKQVGVRKVFSVSAVGSLAEEIAPGHLAIPHQYIDFTRGRRVPTFFGNGIVGHISSAEPACASLVSAVGRVAESLKEKIHLKKTYACVEGPRLGTRAESHFLRKAGCDLVGMTAVPEVFLAREAQLCYCTISVVTDYDCWLDDPNQHVSVEQVIALYQATIGRVKGLLSGILGSAREISSTCPCRSALKGALLTSEEILSPSQRQFLSVLRA